MPEVANGYCLFEESVDHLSARVLLEQHLHRDVAPQLGVSHQEHLPTPPGPELPPDLISFSVHGGAIVSQTPSSCWNRIIGNLPPFPPADLPRACWVAALCRFGPQATRPAAPANASQRQPPARHCAVRERESYVAGPRGATRRGSVCPSTLAGTSDDD